MNITAADVNNLRKKTGAGMMDCKKALQEAEGDIEKAIEILRKKGQKVADKRADREATEGCIIAKVSDDHSYAAIVYVSCETDFVSKNEDFIRFTTKICDLAVANKCQTADEVKALDMDGVSVADRILEMLGKIGEKIELVDFKTITAPRVFAYVHPGNRLATIMGLNMADVADIDTIGKEVNMQIAAMAPVAIDKDGVDETTIAKEIEIGKEQARQEGKPEAMLEKIALGKLNKFYQENTLLNQNFVRNNKMSVGQYLQSADKALTVTGFFRVSL
ncbi:MAG: elongation factor Ts [Bacteroidales bacterium]|nr:elongation factor Ts [Bacteroidales bacterium]